MIDPYLFDDELDSAPGLTIRLGRDYDREAIDRLGELDERDPGSGPHLVADEDGDIVAALSLTDDVSVADPFRFTAPTASRPSPAPSRTACSRRRSG